QGIFVRELAALYGASCSGRVAPLPALPIQYADFALWERQWLQGRVLEEELAYWNMRLADLPALQLPTDHPRPTVSPFGGGAHAFRLPKNLCDSLRVLSRREGVTLFMTVLAAFKVLLARYSGQDDIVIGTPVANRNRAEMEDLIGFFVNTLVLRTDLSGN